MVSNNKLRRMIVLALALVSLAGCMASPATPSAQPTIQLNKCQLSSPGMSESVRARCGTLTLPEDRERPSGRQIVLRVAVIPAVSRNPKPDPLFLLAGGPGQAATEVFPAIVTAAFGRIRQERDIVLVDQRGTGQSNPLQCELPSEDTLSDQEVVAVLKACPAQLDADLRFYTTDIAVRDLDQVREALGYAQINLYGASYGTRVALAYLRRYPGRVRTVILDAVVSADFRIFLSAGRDGTQALKMLFERCRADAACQEAFPDLQIEFEALLDKLEKEPAQVTVSDPISGESLTLTVTRDRFAGMVFSLLYAPEVTALLPLSIHAAYADDNYAPLIAQATAIDAGLYRGLLYAVLCTEDVPFITPEQAAALNEGSYFGDMSRQVRQICEAWPRGELPPDLDTPVSSEVPVLLLSGQADPITPPQYAERAAQTLPNSLHLVAPGMGHGIVTRGCVPNLVADFVEAASVKSLDAACVQQVAPPPFFVHFAGPKP